MSVPTWKRNWKGRRFDPAIEEDYDVKIEYDEDLSKDGPEDFPVFSGSIFDYESNEELFRLPYTRATAIYNAKKSNITNLKDACKEISDEDFDRNKISQYKRFESAYKKIHTVFTKWQYATGNDKGEVREYILIIHKILKELMYDLRDKLKVLITKFREIHNENNWNDKFDPQNYNNYKEGNFKKERYKIILRIIECFEHITLVTDWYELITDSSDGLFQTSEIIGRGETFRLKIEKLNNLPAYYDEFKSAYNEKEHTNIEIKNVVGFKEWFWEYVIAPWNNLLYKCMQEDSDTVSTEGTAQHFSRQIFRWKPSRQMFRLKPSRRRFRSLNFTRQFSLSSNLGQPNIW